MPYDLHFICRHGLNQKRIGIQLYETGNWAVSREVAQESIGGRIYLHEHQETEAWHGGTIIDWRESDELRKNQSARLIFTYRVDKPFRIRCPGGWGREKAIVRD